LKESELKKLKSAFSDNQNTDIKTNKKTNFNLTELSEVKDDNKLINKLDSKLNDDKLKSTNRINN